MELYLEDNNVVIPKEDFVKFMAEKCTYYNENLKKYEYDFKEVPFPVYKDVVLEAVKHHWYAITYATKDIKIEIDNKELALNSIISSHSHAYNYISDSLKRDKDIILASVNRENIGFRSIGFENDICPLDYASKELLNDKDFMLNVMKKNPLALEYASDELKNDKEFILDALRTSCVFMKCVSDDLKNDREVAFLATVRYSRNLEFVSDELKNDKEFIKQCMEAKPDCAQYFPSEILEEIEEGMDGMGM